MTIWRLHSSFGAEFCVAWGDGRSESVDHGCDRIHRRTPCPSPGRRGPSRSSGGAQPGETTRCSLARFRGDQAWGSDRQCHPLRCFRRYRRGLLPRSRHGWGRVVLGYRQAKRGERRRRCPRCGGATDRLPGRASSVRPRVVDSLAVPARSRSDPARLRGSDGCVPSWSGDRIGFGVLRNGAPLDQSTSGDDHTQVGAQQHSADRSA